MADAATWSGSAAGGRRVRIAFLLILILGAVLRIIWMRTTSLVIENEGGEYAAIADNLLAGKGYVGQGLTGKPELLFPPFYPGAIAGLALLTHDTEAAGRGVSLIAGLVLIVVLSRLTRHLFGEVAGLVAGFTAAVHPMLVGLSTAVYSEGTYFALVFSGVLLGVNALESRAMKHFVAAGLMFACAYLTRPEAAVYPLALAVVALATVALRDRARLKPTATGVGGMFLMFALLAAPYVHFQHVHTGHWSLEGKSPSNFALGQQMRAGKDVLDAYFGVSEDLRETGVYMGNINRYVTDSSFKPPAAEILGQAARAVPRQAKMLVGTARSAKFGGLLLFLAAVLGFAVGWTRARAPAQALLAMALLSVFASLLSVQFFWARFSYILLPFLIVWGAGGIVWLAAWVATWIKRRRLVASSAYVGLIVSAALAVGVASIAIKSTRRAYDDYGASRDGARITREAGSWLKSQPPTDKVVMDAGSAIPYYAKADYIALPYCSSATAVRYIDSKQPDFVILRGLLREQRPYLDEWLSAGIPGHAAERVYNVTTPGADAPRNQIAIYRWAKR